MIMKTIAKKNYMIPRMEVIQLQNQQTLLTGSNTSVTIGGRTGGGEMGDDWDSENP